MPPLRRRVLAALPPLALAATVATACGPLAIAPPADKAGAGSPAPSATRRPTVIPKAGATGTPAVVPPAATAGAGTTPAAGLIAADAVPIVGKIRIDARYVVALGAGKVLANNGASVLAVGKVVSDAQGLVISNNGGGIVGKIRYGVRQAPAATDLALGATLPVVGMEVRATSLRDGRELTVTPAVTDAQGGFTLEVPKSEAGFNVLLTARVPDSRDERLVYPLVTAAGAEGDRTIDEDSAIVTRFVRLCFVGRMSQFMTTANPDALAALLDDIWVVDRALRDPVKAMIPRINAAAREAGLDRAPAATVEAVAGKVVDAVLAKIDLPAVMIEERAAPFYKGAPEPAMGALLDLFRQEREAAARIMAEKPTFFETWPVLTEYNADREPAQRFTIARPADVPELISRVGFLGLYPRTAAWVEGVYRDLGFTTDPTTGQPTVTRKFGAGDSLSAAIAVPLAEDKDGMLQAALATIRAAKQAP